MMRRILSVLLENESGALSRVIGLFSQRGYNIESLTVAPTDDPTLSRMTIQTVGDEKVLEQIEKQLHKLVDVLRVSELGQGAHVEREIMLVKIQASGYGREEVKRNTEIFLRLLTLRQRCIPFNWRAPAINWMLFWPRCAMWRKLLKWRVQASSGFRAAIRLCAEQIRRMTTRLRFIRSTG